MNESRQHFEQLKYILENLRSPERLDDHPWAHSLTVQDRAAQDASIAEKSPGAQLALTFGDLFRQMMPATHPQKGKRLDTRWGRFGILAAHYFAPFLFGRLQPHSLRDAWRRINSSILLFVYGLPANQLKPEQVEPYQLIGDELDFPANSTISDWHRNGLQDLADLFLSREKHLRLAHGEASGVLDAGEGNPPRIQPEPPVEKSVAPRARRKLPKWVAYLILAACLLALLLLGNEGVQVYHLAQVVRKDIASLEQLNPASLEDIGKLEEASALLDKTHADVESLRGRVSPWLGLTRRLGWVPVHGGDLVHLGDLLDMASGLTSAAQQTFETVYPIWQTIQDPGGTLKASELTAMLLDTRPELEQAQDSLHQATEARQRIEPAALSPEVRGMVSRVDPYLSLLDEALSVALAAPNLLGGTEEGPKTYLVLVQNEDELRPTGGFLTSVGRLVVYQGQLVSWNVEDSYAVDDPGKTYPLAPWQMRSFMNIPVFVFRDSNWYTDYRTTAAWAEYLYAYTNSLSVDGVIAIDQQVLVSILLVLGPVHVDELDVTVTAKNVRDTMRAQKIPPPKAETDPGWHRKRFMKPIASAILGRLLSGQDVSWESVLRMLVNNLDERHILVQLDDPTLSNLLVERSWDGAIRPGVGDFLMVVDTNVGYNKTNAVVDARLAYDVDLTDPAAPISNLVISHHNRAQGEMGEHCDQRPGLADASSLEFWYEIDRCYYNYLRVYVPAGTQLADAAVHAVTREDMVMLDRDVPARVDTLNEMVEGVDGFGTLLVVPMGQSLETGLRFHLHAGILQPGPQTGQQVYRLKIQKQAGIISMPVTVRVHLPAGAAIQSVSPEGIQDGSNVLFALELRQDIEIEILFQP